MTGDNKCACDLRSRVSTSEDRLCEEGDGRRRNGRADRRTKKDVQRSRDSSKRVSPWRGVVRKVYGVWTCRGEHRKQTRRNATAWACRISVSWRGDIEGIQLKTTRRNMLFNYVSKGLWNARGLVRWSIQPNSRAPQTRNRTNELWKCYWLKEKKILITS